MYFIVLLALGEFGDREGSIRYLGLASSSSVRIVSVDTKKQQAAAARIRTAFADANIPTRKVREKTSHDQGCFEGHMAVWRELVASNETGYWVFEDDVKFIRHPLPCLHDYVARYSLSQNSVFYLGHFLSVSDSETYFSRLAHDVLKVSTLHTHAYYIGRLAAANLIGEYRGVPADNYVQYAGFLARVDMRAVYPMVAMQEGAQGRRELVCEAIVWAGPLLATYARRCAALMFLVVMICYTACGSTSHTHIRSLVTSMICLALLLEM